MSESSLENVVEYYIRKLRGPDAENAWFSLMELGPAAIPYLETAFESESDPEVSASLVEIASQVRTPTALPILSKALSDPAPAVWKAAVDGLVTVGSSDAVEILKQALVHCPGDDRRSQEYWEWIQEAIEQMGV